MEATMTMPMTGFKDLSNEEVFSVDGGTNWHQYWAGVAVEVGGCALCAICPEIGVGVAVDGFIAAESALG